MLCSKRFTRLYSTACGGHVTDLPSQGGSGIGRDGLDGLPGQPGSKVGTLFDSTIV